MTYDELEKKFVDFFERPYWKLIPHLAASIGFTLIGYLLGYTQMGAMFALGFYYAREHAHFEMWGQRHKKKLTVYQKTFPWCWKKDNQEDFWPTFIFSVVVIYLCN